MNLTFLFRTPPTTPVPVRIRFLICLITAIIAAHYVYMLSVRVEFHRDLGHVWFAAGEVLRGRSPYASIGPGAAYEWPWPLYYPLPGVLAIVPLALVPEPIAMATFAALGVGAFMWAMGELGYASMSAVASYSLFHATTLVQWSPLLAASLVLTPITVLLVAKPTVGAALFAARPNWWAVGGGTLLLAASFAVDPHWVGRWLAALGSPNIATGMHAGHFAIVQFPGGVFVLAALLRWRRAEARLLGVLACVPQTLLPYESLLLFLIPRGWFESLAMVGLSYAMFVVATRDVPADFVVRTLSFGPAVTWTMYLPATLMVLRRPNIGPAPAWLEARLNRAPSWLRGLNGHPPTSSR
jgi:hypothetical protein